MNELELKKENAELRAKLAIASSFPLKVRMECRKRMKGDDFLSMLHDSANKVLDITDSEQALNDLRVEASMGEIERLLSIMGSEFGEKVESFLHLYRNKLKKEYANTLKGGK